MAQITARRLLHDDRQVSRHVQTLLPRSFFRFTPETEKNTSIGGSQRSMAPSAKAYMSCTWHIRCSTSSERNGRKSERGAKCEIKNIF